MTENSGQETAPHRHRQVAESFGSDTARYDRARPAYPAALVDHLVTALPDPGPDGTDLLDVGCGTGIVARQFGAAGRTVLGVEPDPRMAGFARRTGIEVEEATFETWDPAGRVFAGVVAGQSWHWVAPVEGAAKAARVLRPGGLLAAFAHVFEAPAPVHEALAEVLRRVAPDAPFATPRAGQAVDVAADSFRTFADGIRAAGGFGEPRHLRFGWERGYTREEWLDLLPTTGALTQLPPADVATVLDAVGAAVDALGGGFTMSYTTLAVTAARTGH